MTIKVPETDHDASNRYIGGYNLTFVTIVMVLVLLLVYLGYL